MKTIAIIAALIMLVGCEHVRPFAEVSFGYSTDTGLYPAFDYDQNGNVVPVEIDETGCINHTELGLEIRAAWYIPREIKAYHRSQCDKKPELTSNDVMATWRIGGFDRR